MCYYSHMKLAVSLLGYTRSDVAAAAITTPPPDLSAGGGDANDDDLRQRVMEQWLDELEAAATGNQFVVREGESDPLEMILQRLSRTRTELERQTALLVAYMRERVGPRPYTLQRIATAAGLSISGVRTLYSADDIAEMDHRIAFAAKALADRHRGRTPGKPTIPIHAEADPSHVVASDHTLIPVEWQGPEESRSEQEPRRDHD